METPLTATVLSGILTLENWTQQDLQDRTKIDRTIVSMHLSGKRPVRDEHLAAYIAAAPIVDKPRLLAAWLRDLLAQPDTEILLDVPTGRLKEPVAEWLPDLPDHLRTRLQWLGGQMLRDPDLQNVMVTLIKNFGYAPPAKTDAGPA